MHGGRGFYVVTCSGATRVAGAAVAHLGERLLVVARGAALEAARLGPRDSSRPCACRCTG